MVGITDVPRLADGLFLPGGRRHEARCLPPQLSVQWFSKSRAGEILMQPGTPQPIERIVTAADIVEIGVHRFRQRRGHVGRAVTAGLPVRKEPLIDAYATAAVNG